MSDPDIREDGSALAARSWRGFAWFVAALALTILLSAGTFDYWQGWAFIVHFGLWMAVLTGYFLKHDPVLVRRRLRVGPIAEREPSQQRIQLATTILLIAALIVPALDRRFGWSSVPLAVVIVGHLLLAAGYGAIFITFKANSFASAVVEVGAGQRVVSTGPYALVRHPMYAGATMLFAGMPLALGSWWGLLVVPPLVAALAVRAVDEERLLRRELAGYDDYCRKVRSRLLPGIW